MLNCIYFIKRLKKKYKRIMDLQMLFFTVTYRIIHVTVMSHSRDGNRKEELNLQNTVSLCFKGLIIPVNIK